MAIEFIVEDGSGKTDATSYADVLDFRQYWENRGVDYSTTTDDTIKAWLNLSTEYIDLNYNFEGLKTDNDQALEWPRNGTTKKDECEIQDNEIPGEVIDATIYLSAQSKNNNLQEVSGNVKSEKIGTYSVEYNGKSGTKEYLVVDNYLKWLIKQGIDLMRIN